MENNNITVLVKYTIKLGQWERVRDSLVISLSPEVYEEIQNEFKETQWSGNLQSESACKIRDLLITLSELEGYKKPIIEYWELAVISEIEGVGKVIIG